MIYFAIIAGLVFFGLVIFLIGNQILIQKYYWGPGGQGRFKNKRPPAPKPPDADKTAE
jgi:hypothetical protein